MGPVQVVAPMRRRVIAILVAAAVVLAVAALAVAHRGRRDHGHHHHPCHGAACELAHPWRPLQVARPIAPNHTPRGCEMLEPGCADLDQMHRLHPELVRPSLIGPFALPR